MQIKEGAHSVVARLAHSTSDVWQAMVARLAHSTSDVWQAMGDNRAMEYMRGRRILEINPDSPVIRVLRSKFEEAPTGPEATAMVNIMYETSLLTSGFQVDSPKDYASMWVSSENWPPPSLLAPCRMQIQPLLTSSFQGDCPKGVSAHACMWAAVAHDLVKIWVRACLSLLGRYASRGSLPSSGGRPKWE